jgi:predicted lipoprotein with Yx(FWY)xxD motif
VRPTSMSRNRIPTAAAAVLAAAVLASALLLTSMIGAASARSMATAAGGKAATVKLGNTGMGKILEAKNGFTLYAFTADKHNKNNCVKRSGCTGVWPMFTTQGKPKANSGVKSSMLGTIKVKGKTQVTYGGHPLYEYSGDTSPGSTSYVGVSQFGGTWKAVKASGKLTG